MRPSVEFEFSAVQLLREGRAVLSDINLSIEAGSFCALIGPSGAGKSSLLRLLNRLDDPDAGRILWRARALSATPVREVRRRIGFVFQKSVMFPGSVRDNLLAPLTLSGPAPEDAEARARRNLEAASLSAELLDRNASELSGGEQQRVAIARSLMTEPEVLLLDEPTASLDVESAERLINTLAELRRVRGLCLVMVSHRLEEARACASQVVMLESGRIVESAASADFFVSPRSERAREFLSAAQFSGAK